MRARFINLDLSKTSLNEVFDVLTWSKDNLSPEICKNIKDSHNGKYGEKVQKSLLKSQNKDELLQWHNRTFEIGIETNESLNFEQGGNPYKKIKIGNSIVNRDSKKRLENFKKDNPVNFAWNSISQLKAPGKHPLWQLLNISLSNPKLSKLQDNVDKYLQWFNDNTDFDIVELESAYERDYITKYTKKRIYDQGITIKMRNNDDMS